MNTFIIAAQTIDGFIAKDKAHMATWTSKADKKRFVELTKQAGVVIMGSRTFATLPKPLKDRLNVVYTRNPEKFENVKETKESKMRDNMEDTARGNTRDNVLFTSKPPIELLADLKTKGYSSVAICGGAEIYSTFIKAGLVQKLYITVEPLIFGEGISLFNQPLELHFKLVNSSAVENGAVFLEYELLYNDKYEPDRNIT